MSRETFINFRDSSSTLATRTAGFSAPNECDVSKPRLTNFVAKSKVIHRFCHEVVVKTKERTLIETSSNDRIKSVIVDI